MIFTHRNSPELQQKVEMLRERILTDPVGVLDPESQHHQFASLVNHGRKLDMDKIETGTELFWQWVDTYSQWMKEVYRGRRPDALVGIANGANRLATTMAATVGAIGLETYKKDSKTVGLTPAARAAIQYSGIRFVVLTEDVGTTGGTTSSVVPELREIGVERIEAAHTWIRNPMLKTLESERIPYGAAIHEPLPTFSEEDCRTLPEGFCNQGVLLIPHGQ